MDSEIAWEDCIADLPPLNALSSSSDEDLPQLQLLDLFSIDHNTPTPPTKPTFDHPLDQTLYSPPLDNISTEKLSQCTSTTNSQHSTPSDTSATPRHHTSHTPPPQNPNPHLVTELNTRLSSAISETSALRKRVAALTAENRGLRHALDHANARLVAVAQAASQPASSAPPVVLGLAHVSSDVAGRLAGALTVSDTTEDPRHTKKRKRVTGAATTMACVMFMWGALVGSPGWLKSGSPSTRSDGNLPAVWTSTDTAVAPAIPRLPEAARTSWQPECLRNLKQLPTGTEVKKEKEEEGKKLDHVKEEAVLTASQPAEKKDSPNKMFVDVEDEKAAKVVARADDHDRVLPDYSYVLCRDAANAVDNVKACAQRMGKGESCGQPHTISLILPASAAGLEHENGTDSLVELAEVQCTINSVARIPYPSTSTPHAPTSKYGKVIATVPEGKTEMHKAT